MYTTMKFVGKHVIQTNLSKFDERLFSGIYLFRLRLKQRREVPDFVLRQGVPEGRSSEVYAILKKPSLGLGT